MRPLILALLMLCACSDGSGPGDEPEDVFRQISLGEYNACAVVESGAGYCWGGRSDDNPGPGSVPARYGGDRLFRQLSPSIGTFSDYICGLTTDVGTLCQGTFLVNIDAAGTISSTLAPLANDIPLDTIATGTTHLCGLTDAGVAWCWGDFNAGVRGTVVTDDAGWNLEPNLVGGGLTFTIIGAGIDNTCGMTAAGAVYCWGAAERLGAPSAPLDGTAASCGQITPCAPTPVRTELPTAAKSLFVGAFTSCAVTVAAGLWCWGATYDDGTTSATPLHTQAPPGVASIALGTRHACMLTTAGDAYCLGHNELGQLGTGETGDVQSSPVRVTGDLRFASLSAGSDATCGVTTGGLLYCWGSNEFGQLGRGDVQHSPTPVRVQLPAAAI